MTRATVESVKFSAESVVSLNVNSIGAKNPSPYPLPQGEGEDKRIDRPRRRHFEKVSPRGRGNTNRPAERVYSAVLVSVDRLSRCRPSASKFAGASQRSKAARSRGHSPSMIENQAVSRLRPL